VWPVRVRPFRARPRLRIASAVSGSRLVGGSIYPGVGGASSALSRGHLGLWPAAYPRLLSGFSSWACSPSARCVAAHDASGALLSGHSSVQLGWRSVAAVPLSIFLRPEAIFRGGPACLPQLIGSSLASFPLPVALFFTECIER